MSEPTKFGRKKIAEAVRAFAADCAAGTVTRIGAEAFGNRCAMQQVGERLCAGGDLSSAGFCVGLEILEFGKDSSRCLTTLYSVNDRAEPYERAAAVVAPLNALADALDPPVTA